MHASRSVSSRTEHDLALWVWGRAIECRRVWRVWSGLGPGPEAAISGGSRLFSTGVGCDCDILLGR